MRCRSLPSFYSRDTGTVAVQNKRGMELHHRPCCVQDLSLEGCVHLSGAEAVRFAAALPHLLLLDLTSIKVQDGQLVLLQPLTRLRALRMRRQVSLAAIVKMAEASAAPVWRALVSCPQPRRWIASADGPWAPFSSKVWKTPVLR